MVSQRLYAFTMQRADGLATERRTITVHSYRDRGAADREAMRHAQKAARRASMTLAGVSEVLHGADAAPIFRPI